jgi:hypothetical protein
VLFVLRQEAEFGQWVQRHASCIMLLIDVRLAAPLVGLDCGLGIMAAMLAVS